MTVPLYPGAYIQESGGQPQSIPELPTSITAFVGYAANGPVGEPQRVASVGEFENLYAGSGEATNLDIAVRLFFANGGTDAWIVRLAGKPEAVGDFGDEAAGTGIYALASSEAVVFNLLCLPDQWALKPAVAAEVIGQAAAFCGARCAFLLADVPHEVATVDQAVAWKGALGEYASPNGAVYFPALTVADPKWPGVARTIGASGAMAGVCAATDAQHGVWKAPAGPACALSGVQAATLPLSDEDCGNLSSEGINPLRSFPNFGLAPWGARTLAGVSVADSEWKYIPVRRLAFHVECSLREGLAWVGAEPNGQALRSVISLSVTTFLWKLYTMGAFVGATPNQAFHVRCDDSNNSQADIQQGICIVDYWFAPQNPAEFVTLTLRLKTAGG